MLIINFSLTGRFLNTVLNVQSSGAYQSMQASPMCHLPDKHTLPKSIFTLFVNIYADNTAKNKCTFKTRVDHRLAADFLSDLALTSQWVGDMMVTFNASKIKPVTFNYRRSNQGLPSITPNECLHS